MALVSDPRAADEEDSSGNGPGHAVSDAVTPAVTTVDAVVVESVPMPPADTGYTPAGVPTFEAVREKIETRYGTAIGSAELAAETPEGRSVEEQYEARQQAAAERLEQIRAGMRDEQEPT